jgi:hypothetical protein
MGMKGERPKTFAMLRINGILDRKFEEVTEYAMG